MASKLDQHKDEIIELCKQEKTYQEIGKLLGVDSVTVFNWCYKNNIRKQRCYRKSTLKSKLDKHKEQLITLCSNGISSRDIGDIFNVSKTTIDDWCRENKIRKARIHNVKKYKRNKKRVYLSKVDRFREQVIRLRKEGYSYPKIAQRINVSPQTVHRWFKDNNIRIRARNKFTICSMKDEYTPCEICGFLRFTEEAHIIEHGFGGKNKTGNYIYLCPNHHSLFDRGALTKNEFYTIKWSEKVEKSVKYAMTERVKQHRPFWNIYKKGNK